MERKHTHIGAYGIVTNNKQIILIKKARGGYTGLLDLPGGGIEHTEKPEEALVREIMEEVGITINNYQLINILSNNITWKVREDLYEDLHHLGVIYLVKDTNQNIKTDPDGIDSNGAMWYDVDDLEEAMLTPFAKYAVNYIKNQSQLV